MGSDGGEDFLKRGEAPEALVAAGEVAGGGADECAAVGDELGDVAARGRVVPHFAVHGGCDDDTGAAGEGEIDGGKGIGREAVREIPDGIRAGWGDEEKVGMVGKLDVAGFPGLFLVFEGNEDGLAGEGLEGEGSDELGGGAGHHDVDFMAELAEL